MAHQWRPPSWLLWVLLSPTAVNHFIVLHLVHKVRKILHEMFTFSVPTAFP